jgi:hypothetical protein
MSKPKRRKAREFIVLLSMHGLVVRDANWYGSGSREWARENYPDCQIIKVREVLKPRKSRKREEK